MNKDFKSILWDLSNSLRGTYFSKDFIFVLIRLVFLKYCIDNSIGADGNEDMQACLNAQKAISKRDPEMLLNNTIPVLRYLDKAYKLDSILSSFYNINEYAEIFGVDTSKQRRSVNADSYKNAIEALAGFDFDEDDREVVVGKNLVTALISLFYEFNQKSLMAKEISTSSAICEIAAKILGVKKNEVFCDFCSGIGFSTIAITGDSLPTINTFDKTPSVAPIAAMLYIMYGYKNISVLTDDSLSGYIEIPKADKVFVDVPLGLKLSYGKGGARWESSSIAADIALNKCLNENGLAVITAPSSTLFQSSPQSQLFKEELVLSGCLKAIVSLPALWQGTNAGTNLLVLSKAPVKNTLFINSIYEKVPRDSSKAIFKTINEEVVDEIVDLIRNPRNIAGFARVVSANELAENRFNLLPTLYIQQEDEEDTTTVAEIDNQLNELYKQLLG